MTSPTALSPTSSGARPPPLPQNMRAASVDSTTSQPSDSIYDSTTNNPLSPVSMTAPPPLPANRLVSVELDPQTTVRPIIPPKRITITSPLSNNISNNVMSPIHEVDSAVLSPNSTNNTTQQYSASVMSQHLDMLMKQADAGTHCVKRISSLLHKLYTIQLDYANQINKLLTNESQKQQKYTANNTADTMHTMNTAFKKLIESLHEHSKQTIESAQLLNIDVIEPLHTLFEQCDNKRKVLVQTEKQSISEVSRARADVSARYQKCTKLLQQLNAARNNEQTHSTTNNHQNNRTDSLISSTKSLFNNLKSKVVRTPAQLQSDAVENSKLYTTSIAFANHRSKQYETSELPYYWQQLQQLECERIESSKQKLIKYAAIQCKRTQQQQQLNEYVANCMQHIDATTDITMWMKRYIRANRTTSFFNPYTYELSLTAEQIAAGMTQTGGNKVFRKSLDTCIDNNNSIPSIVTVCCDYIEQHGLHSEGIFRISVDSTMLDDLVKQLDTGNIDITTYTFNDPHTAAALLKKYFRLLPDSLIPQSLYSTSITYTAEQLPTQSKQQTAAFVRKLLSELPTVNQHVITRVIALVKQIVAPDNSKHNLMSIESMSVVLAPSFLSNPSDDSMQILNDSRYETQFMSMFLTTLVDTS